MEPENYIDLIRSTLPKLTWADMEAVAKSLERWRNPDNETPDNPITGYLLLTWAEECEIEE